MKIGDRIALTLENLALGGEAIARIDDGMVVFVRGGIPGDKGIVEITKRKRQFASGKLVELLEPSTLRIIPRCEYFGRCGGCKWQYLNYDDQLTYKQQQIVEAFAHIGKIREMASERTVVLISHRMSTVKLADRIYVMKEGRLTEAGSHDELVKLNGIYAELFELQARNYRD